MSVNFTAVKFCAAKLQLFSDTKERNSQILDINEELMVDSWSFVFTYITSPAYFIFFPRTVQNIICISLIKE